MRKGRSVPPVAVIFAPQPERGAALRAMELDAAFFDKHPTITKYTRDYIPGESPGIDHPAGTKVVVIRVGMTRNRLFQHPDKVVN